VKIIHIRWLSALPAFVLAAGAPLVLMAGAAMAQDFTAGKTPAQLFSSDCSTCHHLPNGLGKKYDTGSLGSFLREHYTTKPDTAGSLAKYVMGFATLRAAPITAPSGDEGGAARSAEDPKARRRTSNLSGDGEKPARPRPSSNPPSNPPGSLQGNPQTSEEPPRPAAAIAQPSPAVEAAVQPPAARNAPPARARGSESESSPPAAKLNDAKLNDYARSGAAVVPREAADPISRIRAYATSGAGPQEAAAEAPKPASGKSHRRSDGGAPPAQPAPADSVAAPVPAVPVVPAPPANPNAMPPPAPLSAVTPAPAAVTPAAI
jgi:hypothetical protein